MTTASPALDLTASPPGSVSYPFVVPELLPGQPLPRPELAACLDPRCGETGAAVRALLPSPRTTVIALLDRYIHAMNARAPEALRPLFDTVVAAMAGVTARESTVYSRERVVALHAQLLDLMDRRGFGVLTLRVVSYDECRSIRCGALLRPGEWYVEWRPTSFRVSPTSGAVPPNRMVVRVTDGSARIVALNEEFFLRRGP